MASHHKIHISYALSSRHSTMIKIILKEANRWTVFAFLSQWCKVKCPSEPQRVVMSMVSRADYIHWVSWIS